MLTLTGIAIVICAGIYTFYRERVRKGGQREEADR